MSLSSWLSVHHMLHQDKLASFLLILAPWHLVCASWSVLHHLCTLTTFKSLSALKHEEFILAGCAATARYMLRNSNLNSCSCASFSSCKQTCTTASMVQETCRMLAEAGLRFVLAVSAHFTLKHVRLRICICPVRI